MADRETLAVYAARVHDYANRFAQGAPDAHLEAFIASLPDGARVLDLGCGTGQSTAFMTTAGLETDAMDASPEMAALARKNSGVDVKIAAFDALDATALYDGIYANFSLLHAPKADMPDHLSRIARALKPDGMFHIGLKTGKGEARDALGRFYAYYEDAEITDLLQSAGLTPLDRSFGAGEGLDGTLATWIVILATKST